MAVDSFSSIDIETKEGREKCRDEMFRTLKPGGYALVMVCSADDEWEKELRKISKPAFKLGREGTATNLWAVLRKST